jgi:type IV secretion system protein TrbL
LVCAGYGRELLWRATFAAAAGRDVAVLDVRDRQFGFFFWLLQNGPSFGNAIINSFRQLGGQASGGGQTLYPGDLISLGIQVVNGAVTHVNWLAPAATGIPILFAVIILVVCCLISANMIFLLCAAWVVVYAGLIFLGFGGSRWTSDWALGYWKTLLGIGASLMTMQLIIGIGATFLKDIVQQTGNNGDLGQLTAVLVAVIILAVVAHQLPKIVAGMVQGGGYGGHVGHMGMLSLLGIAFAGARLAGATGAVSAVASAGADGAQKLMERISAVDAGGSNGSSPSPMASGAPMRADTGSGPSSAPQAGAGPRQTSSSPPPVPQSQSVAQSSAPDDPPESRPTAPYVSRGFEEPVDFGAQEDEQA